MKQRIRTLSIISLIGLFTLNCGSNKGPDLSPDASRKTIKDVPAWYIDAPVKESFKYVASTATSQDMQMAVNKATLDASNRLVGQVESEMNALVKRAQEETGLGADSHIIDRFSQTQEQVITTSLKDWSVSKKEIQEEKSDVGRIYRAYVLVEWDAGAAHQRLLNQLKQNEEIYTQIRATELFDEMEQKVEAYRERYGK